MLAAAGCRNRTGFQFTLANGAFLILRTVGGSRCFGVDDPVAGGMSCFAVFNDDATANNRTFFPMVILIRLPTGRSMSVCRKDDTGLVGNFHRTGCVLKPLVTAVTCVICFIARSGASCRIFINKRQIMGMRNGIIIGTGIADVIVSVIVSRFVLFVVATRTFVPVVCRIVFPIRTICMTESSIHRYEGICCADCTAGAALEIYCVACAVSRGFKCFRFYSFLIVGVRMWSVLVGRFHAYCTCRHSKCCGCAVCVCKGNAAAYNFPLIKYLVGRSRICSQGNDCALRRFADFASCAYCRFTVCNGDSVFNRLVGYNNIFVSVHCNGKSISCYSSFGAVYHNLIDFIT